MKMRNLFGPKFALNFLLFFFVAEGAARATENHNESSNVVAVPPLPGITLEKVLKEIPTSSRKALLGVGAKRQSNNSAHIRDFCITIDRIGHNVTYHKVKQLLDVSKCETLTANYRIIPATRPGNSNFVAILKISSSARPILNPISGFNYGSIPLLQEMTLKDADNLWGPAQSTQDNNYRIYPLETKNEAGTSAEYQLNCRFENGKLAGYEIATPEHKILGPGEMSQSW